MQMVEDYILELDGPQRDVMEYLHQLISTLPEIVPRIRYRIPFYYRKSWICYLNPVKKNGVELVFVRGNELSNEQGLLASRGRKQVSGIIFFNVESIPVEPLLEVLQEAIVLDQEVPYASKRSKNHS